VFVVRFTLGGCANGTLVVESEDAAEDEELEDEDEARIVWRNALTLVKLCGRCRRSRNCNSCSRFI
jgi:hypothetical protein